MRLTTVEKPVKDEMMMPYMEHLADINGLSISELLQLFFQLKNKSRRNPRKDYLVNLEKICMIEKESRMFPDLLTILSKHTDLYESLAWMTQGIQAKYFENCLRDFKGRDAISYVAPQLMEYKICPACTAEDLQKYGRIVIHVPHQSEAVNGCWKHGTKLISVSEFENGRKAGMAKEEEHEIAVFIHDLYENPLLTTYELVKQTIQGKLEEKGLDLKQAVKAAAKDGYLDEKQEKQLLSQFSYYKNNRISLLPRFLTWLYHTAEDFRKSVPEAEFLVEDSSDFEVLKREGPLAALRCRTCGAVFHIHTASVGIGVPCPKCVLTEAEVMDRYLSHYGNGEYVFADDSRKKIRHTVCGYEIAALSKYRFWSNVECQECKKKDMEDWQDTIDAEKKEYLVQEVTRNTYRKPVLEIKHLRCKHSFIQSGDDIQSRGIRCPFCDTVFAKIREGRVGEKGISKDGEKMEIIAYRSNLDMDVRKGNRVIQMTYDNFRKGLGQQKTKIQELLGTEKYNRHEDKMKLVDYKTQNAIYVQFEDGTIVKTDMARWKLGTVFYPGDEEQPRRPIDTKDRIGERRQSKKGFWMTIISYRSARDIDIEFDDGTIAEHRTYEAFTDGRIRKPKKQDCDR